MPNNPTGKPGQAAQEDLEMESRLWDYIDGTSKETAVIEGLLAQQEAWKLKYTELLDLNELVKATELEEPPLRFTKNVMDEIARQQIAPAARKYIDTKIIWGIAAFFLTVITGFLVYGLSQINTSTSDYKGSSSGVDFTALDYSKIFNNNFVNAFMMANVILGLLLLDRYLTVKKKKLRQGVLR